MDIAAAEMVLGLTFPQSYRIFLTELGGAHWPDYIYGTGWKDWREMHVDSATLRERSCEPNLPLHLIAISPDGLGNSYCLDTSQWPGSECPVVIWQHEFGESQRAVYSHGSFAEWLSEAIAEELDDEENTQIK